VFLRDRRVPNERNTMKPLGFLAVGSGSIGAWLRWWLGLRLNAVLPAFPLGTLAANLLGGFAIGVAIALFDRHPALAPEVRLLVVTGMLGGLTTFSTFSAELASMLARADLGWATAMLGAHVGSSVLLTALGMLAVRALSGA
jgi:CrcB protein